MCNFSMNRSVSLFIGRLVGRSVKISFMGGKLHVHVPIRTAIVKLTNMFLITSLNEFSSVSVQH